jgi:hypothetical protein
MIHRWGPSGVFWSKQSVEAILSPDLRPDKHPDGGFSEKSVDLDVWARQGLSNKRYRDVCSACLEFDLDHW